MNISTGAIAPVNWGISFLRRSGINKDKGKTIPPESPSAPTEDSTFEVQLVDGETICLDLDRLRQNTKCVHDGNNDILIQDVVKEICKKKEIAPNNAGFFGLKCEFSSGTSMWVVQTKEVKKVKQEKKKKFHFRLQFKVMCGQELRKRDSNAYDYYLKQCRYDFKNGAFSKQLEGRENEKILLRIVILEMMMLYQEVSKEEKVNQLKDMLKNRYRKYFSIDEILKKYYDRDGPRDMTRCRQKVEKSLNCFAKVTEPDKDFITEIELLSNFKNEVFYLNKYERAGSEANQVEVWVSPKDVQKKVLISNVRHSYWVSPYSELHQVKFCEVQGEVKFMIIRGDEPPEVMYCANEQAFESFCSFIDGYYRLLVNQYNSIVNESTHLLLRNSCFGPIHRDEAARILSKKGDRGTYLIREHTKHYGSFALSLISDEHDFLHVEILREEEDNKKFYLCGSKNFDTIEDMCKFYADTKNSEEIKGTLTTRIHPKHAGLIPLYTDPANFRPIIASLSKTQLQPLKPPSQIVMLDDGDLTEDKAKGSFSKVNISRTRDGRELVVKRLENIKRDELLDLYSVLKSTEHERIVALVGISINNMFLAYEYLTPLEEHLIEKRSTVTYGVLLKYLVQIAEAVEFLHSKKCVHGDLTLSNLYLPDVNTNYIKVGNSCVKWKMKSFKNVVDIRSSKRFNFFAPEIIFNLSCSFTEESDVWAFGLTVWQLFTLEQPFRNYNYEQLKIFFVQHMDNKIAQQPGLIHLNMHNLPFCSDEMFKMLNTCLRMETKNRSSMDQIKFEVDELSKKAATKDKKKCYFIHDWKDQSTYDVSNVLIQQNNNHQFSTDMKKHSMETDDYTTASSLLKNGDAKDITELDLSIVKSEVTDVMDTSFCENDPDINQGVKAANGSQSAPSSPNRPKLYRSNSDGGSKRGDEDLETASILVGLSQTNLPQNEKRSQSVTKEIKPEINPSLQSSCMLAGNSVQSINSNKTPPLPSFVQNEVLGEMGTWAKVTNLNSQPVSHINPHPSHPVSHTATQQTSHSTSYAIIPPLVHPSSQVTTPHKGHSNTTIASHTSISNDPDRHRFPPPHIPPPDSPEAVRREFTSETSKRELPKNDRTRLYLQERINKERDRFHGKRSLSFTDEFEEYKNNTIRAAKRALLGPNPFNIGMQLPDDFLIRTDKRLCQGERTLPPEVKRYFNSVHIGDNMMNNSNNMNNNPNNMEYIPVQTIIDMRNNQSKEPNDPRDTQLREKLANMKTHSPGPPNCEETNNFSMEQANMANSNVNTRSIMSSYPSRSIPYSIRPSIPHNNPPPLTSNRNCKDSSKFMPPYNVEYPPLGLMRKQLPGDFMNAFPRILPVTHRPIQPQEKVDHARLVNAGALFINNLVRNQYPPQVVLDHSPYVSEVQVNIPIQTNGFRQIDKESLIEEKKLGTGAFGEVVKGIWKFGRSGVNVAIKRLIASDEPNERAVVDIHTEAKNLATLSNDDDPAARHIIKLYGICLDDKMYQIVEEYAQYGQLDSYIQRNKEHIKDGDILNYCKQVAFGMNYMHNKGVIHRDLACRNILVTDHTHIKISDFGMSRQPTKDYYRVRDVEKAKIPIRWCALESITKNTYSNETDYWSYGVSAWEMYSVYREDFHDKRATPYINVEDVNLISHLDKGNRLPQPSTCPNEVWNKIYECWHVDPKKRPTFHEFKIFLNNTMKEMEYHT